VAALCRLTVNWTLTHSQFHSLPNIRSSSSFRQLKHTHTYCTDKMEVVHLATLWSTSRPIFVISWSRRLLCLSFLNAYSFQASNLHWSFFIQQTKIYQKPLKLCMRVLHQNGIFGNFSFYVGNPPIFSSAFDAKFNSLSLLHIFYVREQDVVTCSYITDSVDHNKYFLLGDGGKKKRAWVKYF
jgi:hypothetical protein